MTDPALPPTHDRALREMARALPSGGVVTDPAILVSYSSDASEAPPIVPTALLRPRNTEQVASIMKIASENSVFITPRGAGTNRVGSATPVKGGMVLSTASLGGTDLDPVDRMARVGPATTTHTLHKLASSAGMFYPPDPNSLLTCTVGGNVATNAGGPRAYGYGVTRDYVLGLTLVTGTGDIVRVGRSTRKGVTGYDLVSLIVGSEGTLGVVTEVTLRLLPERASTVALFATFREETAVANAIRALSAKRLPVVSAELLDSHVLGVISGATPATIPNGARAALLMEIDGDERDVERNLEGAGNVLTEGGALEVLVAKSATEREALWSPRRTVSTELRRLAKSKLSEDVVVPTSKLAELLKFTSDKSDELEIAMPTYGHAGDGNMHVNFLWNTKEERTRVDSGIRALFERVVELKGTLSGEHGIGVMKAPFLALEQSPTLIALQERIKAAFDPKGVLNPGKIFPAAAKKFHGVC